MSSFIGTRITLPLDKCKMHRLELKWIHARKDTARSVHESHERGSLLRKVGTMTKRVAMTLQINVRRALFERGWSATQAAREMGMDANSLNQRIRGVRSFRVTELVRLAAILDVPFQTLVDGVEDSPEYQEANVIGKQLRARDEAAYEQ